MTPLFDIDDGENFSLFLEIATVFSLLAGVLVFRYLGIGSHGLCGAQPSKKRLSTGKSCAHVAQPCGEKCSTWLKTMEAELSAGNSLAAVDVWRKSGSNSASSVAVIRLAAQALLDASPGTLVGELIDHLADQLEAQHRSLASAVLDVVARSGKVELLAPLVEGLCSRLRMRPSRDMHESVTGGYAFAGNEVGLAAHMARMRKAGEALSARGQLLVLRGLFRHDRADGAVAAAKDMVAAGFTLPAFVPVELARCLCRAGRAAEVLGWSGRDGFALSAEAIELVAEHCQRQSDGAVAAGLWEASQREKVNLSSRARESILKVLVACGDERAFEAFDAMQLAGSPITEGFCMCLLAKGAESKFLPFAKVVAAYARRNLKMSVALYSAQMKVYAYSNMYIQACGLYDELKADGHEPDQPMVSCLMRFAAACGRSDLTEELASKNPSFDSSGFMARLRVAAQERNVVAACDVIEKMKASSHAPDTAAYNCALDVCAVAGDVRRARMLLDEMRSPRGKAKPDIITYNTVLKALAASKNIHEAKYLLKEMHAAMVPPNDVSYNIIVNMAATSGNLEAAWDAVDAMTKEGIKVDPYTLATLMKAVKRSKDQRDVRAVFDFLDRSGIEVTVDEVLLNTVLDVCVQNKEKQRIQAILASLSASALQPAVHTYGMLIRAHAALRQTSRCRELWQEMVVMRSLKPNTVALGCMLDALVNDTAVEEAVDLLRTWKNVVGPNAVMYSMLFKGFAAARQSGRAMELLAEMRSDGVPLSTALYNSLIDVQARLGDTAAIKRLRASMNEDGCEPDDFTTSLVVKAYCAGGYLTSAFEVFRLAYGGRRVAGDTVTFNTLLDGCVRHGDFRSAEELLERLVEFRIRPTNFTVGIIIKMYGRQRDLSRAFGAAENMPRLYGFTLNVQSRTCLMGACLMNDDLDRALKVFAGFKSSGVSADAKAYTSLITGAARLGSFELAVRLCEEGFRLHARDMETSVLHQLTRTLAKAGQTEVLSIPLLQLLCASGVPVADISSKFVDAARRR